MPAKGKGRFIDPMLLLRTDSLPNGGVRWEYQLKFDGYRAIAFRTGGKIHLRSRNDNDFSLRYSNVVQGLAKLPHDTVIDGEVIARDGDGRPSFSILQNYGSSKAPVLYIVFDVMPGREILGRVPKIPHASLRSFLPCSLMGGLALFVRCYATISGRPE